MEFFICVLFCFFSLPLFISATPEYNVLVPISDKGWPGMEIRHEKRTERHLVTPQDMEHFVWGSENGIFANMTLNTGEDELVISMERFAGKLKAAECNENMSFTFKNASTFEHAKDDWEWVNFEEKRTFILVDYPGCGDESSRDIWVVSNVHYDEKSFTVYLNATKKEWSDVARVYSIDFGKYTSQSSDLATRGFLGSVGDAIGDAVDEVGDKVHDVVEAAPAVVGQVEHKVEGVVTKVEEVAKAIPTVAKDIINDLPKVDGGKDFIVNLNKAIPGQFLRSTRSNALTLGIECVSCGTRGSLKIDGHIKVGVKGVEEFTITTSTKDIAADLTLKLSLAGTLDRHGMGWKKQWDLIKLSPVPGLAIPKILTIGPNIQLVAGFSIDAISGSAIITSGVVATLPNSKAKLGFTVDDKLKFHGKLENKDDWAPTFKKKPLEIDAQINAELNLYVQMNIAFSLQLDILKTGTQANIGLKIPEIKIMAEAKYGKGPNAAPVCPNSLKTSGISINSMAGADIVFQAYDEIAGRKDYFIDEKLFSKPDVIKFPPFCKGFGPDKKTTPGIEANPSVGVGAAGGVGGVGGIGAVGGAVDAEPSTFLTSTMSGTILPSVAVGTGVKDAVVTGTAKTASGGKNAILKIK